MIEFIRDLFHNPFFITFLAVVACGCFYFIKKGKDGPLKKIVWTGYSLLFAGVFIIFVANAIYRIYHPQVWDFTAFYLYGKVAAAGYNFYVPDNFHTVFNTLDLPPLGYNGLIVESVNVGFPYPPPTILLFSLLGFLSFKAALISWTIFIFCFAMACIYQVYDMFFSADKLNGLLLVATLFLIATPVQSTIAFSQTNFILLFLLLSMKKYEDSKYAGILLALAFFTKPYMVIFGLVFLLRQKWKALFYCAGTAIVLVCITALIFGTQPFFTYVNDNPSKRLPGWVFSEDINQSLHAVLLRANLITLEKHIVYIYIIAALLALTAVYLFFLLRKKMYDYIWMAALLVGQIIYPGTLSYYGVLLLFIIFQFFDEKKYTGFKNIYLNIAIVGAFFYLSTISVFTCLCFLLLVIVIKSFSERNNLITGKFVSHADNNQQQRI